MASLLSGLRVIDLTNNVAGPLGCYQLAQLGAEVIKVERPGIGDPGRSSGADAKLNAVRMGLAFLAHGAGKKSVTINLKSDGGKEVFLRLVNTADAVVTSFRPGVMHRLGIGYEQLTRVRPDIVYCALSGFGSDGPLAGYPAYDQIIQGLSGLMSITGDEKTGPLRVGYPICDALAGITAAFAIVAALFRRERTGHSEHIDLSMLEASLVSMGWVVPSWLVADIPPKASGNQNVFASPSGTFKTGDGLINLAAHTQKQFHALCHALGRPDLVEDFRFIDAEARKRNRDPLTAELEDSLARHPALVWVELLNAEGIPAGPLLSVPEILEHPQIIARDFVQVFNNALPDGRSAKVLRCGFRLRSGDPAPTNPPPTLGVHTEEVLAKLGYTNREITALREGGAI
jgi:crotonobetainyl-CoA:carnitine CoA-transferase CaiB-like acyl-CoA transferase